MNNSKKIYIIMLIFRLMDNMSVYLYHTMYNTSYMTKILCNIYICMCIFTFKYNTLYIPNITYNIIFIKIHIILNI